MSKPICKVKDAQVPLTAETLLEIARVLRADSTLGSLVIQTNTRAVGSLAPTATGT
jgi:hypothetical protein